MKILLDNIIYSKAKNGGVSNYWYELSKYLLYKTPTEISFIEGKNDFLNFHRNLLNLPKESIIPVKNNLPVLSRLMPILYKSNEEFVYHSSYYRKLSNAKNAIEVSTVYDFVHNYYASPLKRTIHNNLKFNAIKRSKGVICISKNTYSDLQKFSPTKKSQKTEVIYVGVSDDYFPISNTSIDQQLFLRKNKIDCNYLLFVSGRVNYKNFDFVIKILNQDKDLKLVLVGGGPLAKNEISRFSKSALERLIVFGSVNNVELNLLYNHALALIYPSSYEGFGIPVVEAMRAGCPVIGLNNAVIKEVASESAILLDNLELKEFETQKQKLLNSDFRSNIIDKGLVESQKYSWEKCSRETHEFYSTLYT